MTRLFDMASTLEKINRAALRLKSDPELSYKEAAVESALSVRTLYRHVPVDSIPTRIPANHRKLHALFREGKRPCGTCKKIKILKEFPVDREAKIGVGNRCTACNRKHAVAYYHKTVKPDAKRVIENARRHKVYIQSEKGRAAQQRGTAARRARKLGAFVEPIDKALLWELEAGICGICQLPCDASNWHMDHIIPLSKGGLHAYHNVQVAHPFCNQSKGASLPDALPVIVG